MKFIVNSQVLSKHLQSINGAITNNNTVPIINCFHFMLDENKLTIKATDLKTTLVTTVNVDGGSTEGLNVIAIPAALLLNVLKALDDVPTTFTVDESNFSITIASGNGRYTIAGRNAETFPALPVIENAAKITIPASVLVSAFSKTAFATSSDIETHEQLSGIFCELTTDHTTFVATDGHKLVRFRRTDITADENASFILPSKPISMIKGLLSSNKEDLDVTLEYNNVNVSFSFANYYAICRLIDSHYPNYEAVIPKENPIHMTIDRMAFLNVVKRINLFTSQSTHQIRLTIGSDTLQISGEDTEFANAATDSIPCALDGNDIEIGFNAKFLTEMLSNLESEQVCMNLSIPSRPGIITPVADGDGNQAEDILMLVMPVSLNTI
ncbi:MAG: DNA polymerase III subunit beta [Bacteroidales bacterium]|nr:DNA polymerase III subunit beta [Candidatus Colimorpha onthohippi]